jgi:recombination protein RecA
MDKDKKADPSKPGTALVFINQTRANISTGGGGGGQPQDNTSGGKALKFFAYVRLQLQRIGSEYIEKKDPLTGKTKRFPYGNQTKVKCVKSKCDAKQGHEVEIFIRYGYGIDNYYSVIQTGQAQGVIRKDGSWLTLGTERFQGRDKLRQHLIDNPRMFDDLIKKVNVAVLSTADQAIDDDELSEEDQLMAEMAKDMGIEDDDIPTGPVPEVVLPADATT